jgi:hypothetical protein
MKLTRPPQFHNPEAETMDALGLSAEIPHWSGYYLNADSQWKKALYLQSTR